MKQSLLAPFASPLLRPLAGITILRRLPNGEGPRLLRLLIANNKTFDHFEADRLKAILAAVEEP